VDVLGTEPVLVAVLHEAPTRVDHEDASAGVSVLLVDNDDACGNPRAIEEVGGESDDAFDEPSLHQVLANLRFPVPSEKHSVGKDDGALSGALERLDEVEQERVVAVLRRRDTEAIEPLKFVVLGIEAAGPCLR
jgi:hypothetical protein